MIRIIFLFLAVIASGQVLGDTAYFTTTVTKILLQEGLYGDCMAEVNPGPETALPNCASYWVTFSCSGDFNSKSEGELKFQSAQLAMLSGKPVKVTLDDSKKHNGYCFVRRIDVE